jgi:hypothetical protein
LKPRKEGTKNCSVEQIMTTKEGKKIVFVEQFTTKNKEQIISVRE